MSSEKVVGIEDARKQLGDLVTAAQQGADVILTRNGKPAARLVRIVPPTLTVRLTHEDDGAVMTLTVNPDDDGRFCRVRKVALNGDGSARRDEIAYTGGVVDAEAWVRQLVPDLAEAGWVES